MSSAKASAGKRFARGSAAQAEPALGPVNGDLLVDAIVSAIRAEVQREVEELLVVPVDGAEVGVRRHFNHIVVIINA